MKSHLRALFIALPAVVLVAPAKDASAFFPAAYSGITCVPLFDSNNPNIFYNWRGVGNRSSSPEEVLCNAPQVGTSSINNVTVNIYDNSPFVNDFCCTAVILNENGILQTHSTQCASGTSIGKKSLSISPPGAAGRIHLDCTIPRRDPTNGASYIASFSYRS
jgi:hypothetical protein